MCHILGAKSAIAASASTAVDTPPWLISPTNLGCTRGSIKERVKLPSASMRKAADKRDPSPKMAVTPLVSWVGHACGQIPHAPTLSLVLDLATGHESTKSRLNASASQSVRSANRTDDHPGVQCHAC